MNTDFFLKENRGYWKLAGKKKSHNPNHTMLLVNPLCWNFQNDSQQKVVTSQT